MLTEDTDEKLWFCVYSRPKQESKVAQILRKEVGVEVFSPRLRFRRARREAPVWFTEALFPGYVFARFEFALHHRQIRAASGVSGIVTFGGLPSPLADEVISEMRKLADDSETVQIPLQVVPGSEIVVGSGPMAGLRALVTRVIPARQRVAILFEILGQMREVEIEQDRVLLPNPRLFG